MSLRCRSVYVHHPWFGLDPFTGPGQTRYLTETYTYQTSGAWVGTDVLSATAVVTVKTSRQTGEQVSIVITINGTEHYRRTIDPTTGQTTETASACWTDGHNSRACPNPDPNGPNSCDENTWLGLCLLAKDWGAQAHCLQVPPGSASFDPPVTSGDGTTQTTQWSYSGTAGPLTGSVQLQLSDAYAVADWVADVQNALDQVNLDTPAVYDLDNQTSHDYLRPAGTVATWFDYEGNPIGGGSGAWTSAITVFYAYTSSGFNRVALNTAADLPALAYVEITSGDSQGGKTRCQYPAGQLAWSCILSQTQNPVDQSWNADAVCLLTSQGGPVEQSFTPNYPGLGLGHTCQDRLPNYPNGLSPCCDSPSYAGGSAGASGSAGVPPGSAD